MRPDFTGFPKISRLSRECVITEKIDGTNAQVVITEDGEIYAGSRKKWITPEDDNFGFAKWVEAHKEELIEGLGPGQHFGEWWGQGIQRRYGLDEKRFSLFNVARWTDDVRPRCCYVVPIVYQGPFSSEFVENALAGLARNGSLAAPGFPNPEGIIIYHAASKTLFKKTIENDESPKGNSN